MLFLGLELPLYGKLEISLGLMLSAVSVLKMTALGYSERSANCLLTSWGSYTEAV